MIKGSRMASIISPCPSTP